MKFQRRKVASALAYTLSAGSAAALIAAPAIAADIKVEVTGSNIKRVEGEGALPVQTITARQIQEGGFQDTFELLQSISANQSFGSFNPAGGEGTTLVGFTGASLRGLGSQRTLVLLNGRRVAPYALANTTSPSSASVDLSSIPIAAIERVEVLKDGASAIYGTDAIAGVINFILRKDYTGVDVGFSYLDTQDGGAQDGRAWGVFGVGDLAKDKYNFMILGEYDDQKSLRAIDRSISKTSFIPELGRNRTSGNTIPSNISIPGVPGTKNPGYPTCLPPFSFITPPVSPGQCRFDYAATIDTIPPAQKGSVVGSFIWQFNPDNQAYLEGSYYHGDFIQRISPTPVSSAFTNNPTIMTPANPFYPTNYIVAHGGDPTKPIGLSYRALEFGPRTDEAISEQYRAVAGLRGVIFGGWDYNADFNYTQNNTTDNYTDGYLSENCFLPLLANGPINPFGFNTDAARAAGSKCHITGQASNNKAGQYGVEAKISNDIWKLPAGNMAAAIGFEWRRESLELNNADFLNSGDIIGGAGAIPSLPKVYNNVTSFYGELNIPILTTLEANAAVRYDHYQDISSSTWNPKFSLRWQPTKDLLFRGSVGTGFRAPTLSDLFQPTLRTNTANNFDDPLRCPTTQSVYDCQLQFNALQGGNPLLQPERSTQYNVGVVYDTPELKLGGWSLGTMSFGLDYYWIKLKDALTPLTADTIFANYNAYTQYVVRGPPTPDYPNLPGPIQYVLQTTFNFGKQYVNGIDVEATWRLPTAYGNFTTNFSGTYINDFTQLQLDGTYPNFAGTSGSPNGAIARWRHYLTFNWTTGPWGATVAQTFQDGYTETYISDFTQEQVSRRVGTYSIWDVQGRFTGIKNTTVALGVKNIFNRAPPVAGGVGTFQFGYDSSYGDPRGTQYYGYINIGFH